MCIKRNPLAVLIVACLAFGFPTAVGKGKHGAREEITAHGQATLWVQPSDLKSRDLFYGPGGKEHVPHGPFTFVKEDLDGTNPKFVVKDPDGVKWKVKLGIEARPETVASRIVWSVGYFANEDYFVPDLQVTGMPARLHRGQDMVAPDGSVHSVRLKRESADERKIGNWSWRSDAFAGTRELNGLKTLMAVINNWDLKDENNAIYQIGDQRIYMVSDLGASFGTPGRTWPPENGKGNLDTYSQSRFIRSVMPETVSFQTPARPRWVCAVNPKEYLRRIHLEWIGRNIPKADAKWMGTLLSGLSTRQIHDAFRAAGYSPQEVDAFSKILERRIAELTDL
jgi:hypothetical protein